MTTGDGRIERLFVACELPDAVRDAVALPAADTARGLGARPVPRDNLHMTLVFLGPTSADAIPAIVDALTRACRGIAPIRAPLREIAGPPGRATSRIVAAVFGDPEDRFGALAASIAAELGPVCAFAPLAMPFWPHVTVATTPSAVPVTPISAESEQMFAFDRVTLYASRSTPSGPAQYVPLARTTLTANDSPH